MSVHGAIGVFGRRAQAGSSDELGGMLKHGSIRIFTAAQEFGSRGVPRSSIVVLFCGVHIEDPIR